MLEDLQQIWKSLTYNEQSTPCFKYWVMLLIFTENKITDRMLPWGTPISCGQESEHVDLSFKTLFMKSGRRPVRAKPWSFISNKMINCATSRSETTLHINEQFVGFEIPDKHMVNHSFHGFTDATCQCNRTIIGRICGILTRLWNRNGNCFPPIRRKVATFYYRYLKVIKERISLNILEVDVFHLVLLMYHWQLLHREGPVAYLSIIRWIVFSPFFSFLMNRCKGICAESRGRIMGKVICQCISNFMMRRDISIIDRQMMNSVTGFLSLDFVGPILYRFHQCLRIHLGDIISPRCFFYCVGYF